MSFYIYKYEQFRQRNRDSHNYNWQVLLEYIEKNQFKVLESLNSKLKVDDIIEVNHFVLNYPLMVNDVVRNGISLGKFTAGKVSGITKLILLNIE